MKTEQTEKLSWRKLGLPVYAVIVILVLFAVFFLVELFTFDPRVHQEPEPVSETSYNDQVASLLANANPANGDALLVKHNCVACHRYGAENGIAPAFTGIAERAEERRPPMPAAAYIYESIINPSAYLAPREGEDEGTYPDAMLKNYADTIPDDELGDIIAYLLTPEAY